MEESSTPPRWVARSRRRASGLRWLLALPAGIGFLLIVGTMSRLRTSKSSLTVSIPEYWGAVLPPLQNSAYAAAVLDNQFEALARRGVNGVMEPLAARSWEISKDYRLIRFRIDTTRRFSDGSFLSAADFKRSWEDGLRMKAQDQNKSIEDALYTIKGYSSFAKTGTLSGVRALNDVLELEFDKPMRVAIEYFSGVRYAAFKIVDGHPIGTGPYSMVEKDKELVLTQNPYYSGTEPRFRNVRIVVKEPAAIRPALLAGEVNATLFAEYALLPECSEALKDSIQCVFSQEAAHLAVHVNGLPGRVFADKKLRQGLQALLNQSLDADLPATMRGNQFRRDCQSFLRFQPGRLPDAVAMKIVRNGEGYIPKLVKTSKKRPLLVVAISNPDWLLSALRSAGVTLDPRSGAVSFKEYLDILFKTHEADLALGGFSVYNGDPDGLYHILGKHGAIHTSMIDRPRVSGLMAAGRAILDASAMKPHYEKVAQAVLEDVPFVHIGYRLGGVAYNATTTRMSESFLARNNRRVTMFEPR